MSPGEIEISVDGASRKVEAGLKVTQVLEQLYPDQMKPGADAIIVCKINGELKDLWNDLTEGDVVESISISSDEGLSVLRHSTAHVLAQAVQDVFPETKLGIGPPIKDGFYYDFDPKSPFTPDDLIKLESAMKKIVKDGQRFKRRVVTDSAALSELSGEPYKCELIKLKSSDAQMELALKWAKANLRSMTILAEMERRSGVISVEVLICLQLNTSLPIN